MTPITDARVLELAKRFEQYPMSKEVTLRGVGIVEFARALLAEHEGNRIGERVAQQQEGQG